MAEYTYKQLGIPLDIGNWESLNDNFKTIARDLNNLSGDVLASVIDGAKLIWQEPVDTFADLATVYPDAEEGWTVFVRNSGTNGETYRFDGSEWVLIQEFDGTAITTVDKKVEGILDSSVINVADLGKLLSLKEENKPVKLAILGDSTKAGVGWRFGPSDTGYAEMGDIDKPSSPEQFFINYLFSSPYFIKPSVELGAGRYFESKGVTTIAGTSPNWDRYVGTFSGGAIPRMALSFKHFPVKRDKLTVYYLARTADGAGQADIIANGITTTFDTYKPPVTYNGVSIPQQGFALQSVTVSIPTNVDTFDVIINNFRQGGSPTPVDGTITVVGFYYGEPIEFKNLAIRATTLTNNSTRNQNKGITTDERFQKAFDFGANVFYIGWGTNDVTDGVSVATFGQLLRDRIDQIRAYNPNAIIILDSAYSQTTVPVTVDSRAHFAEVKKIALEKAVSFIDVDAILRRYDAVEVINDYVHQTEYGYNVVGDGMSTLFRVPKKSEATSKQNNARLVNDYNTPVEIQATNGQMDLSGSEVVVLTANVNLKGSPTLQILSKLALESTSNFTNTRFRLAVTQYAQLNQQTNIGYEIVDASRFHLVFPVGDTTSRQGTATLLCTKQFPNAASLKIEVLGQNFELNKSAGYTSKLAVTFH